MRLRFCDLTEQLTLQCGASERGFGAALLQHGAPHAFPSRALTAAETRDAQNEKEMQTVVYASSRSPGESNHKPLQSTTKKPLRAAPQRLLILSHVGRKA